MRAPTARPPTNVTAKATDTSATEKAPVTAAATANWNVTTPDASLKSDSAERMASWRLVTATSRERA